MSDPPCWLLSKRLRDLAREVAAAPDPASAEAVWRQMDLAIAEAGAEDDEDLVLPVLVRSLPDLEARFAAWDRGDAPLPAPDKALLKRAMNAFRRRLKLTRLDDEVTASRNPLSRGGTSSICGVRPPEQYPPEVWEILVRQGRLRDGGHGLLEPAE